MARISAADPAGLGRGALTRRLPVFGQAASTPPAVTPFEIPEGMSAPRFLLRVLLSAKRLTVPAAVFSMAHQIGEAIVPVIAGAAIDRALATGAGMPLVFWLLVLGANFLMLSLSFRFAAQMTDRAAEIVQHRLRATLSRSILHPEGGAARGPGGEVVSTMTNDVARVGMLGLTVYPIGELAGVVFIAVSLLVIHWPLGVVVLVGAPLAVLLMGRFSRRYAAASREYQTLLAGAVGRATDLVTGYRVIKGVRAEAEATRRYREASTLTRDGAYRSVGALGRYLTGSDALSGAFIAGIAGLAGWYAISGELSVGGLIAAVGLAQALLPPMRMLTGNAVPLWAAGVASSGRMLEQHRAAAASAESSAEEREEADLQDAAQQDAGRQDAGRQGADRQDEPRRQDERSGDTPAPGPSGAPPELLLSVPGHEPIRVEPGALVGLRADDATAARIAHALLHPNHGTGIRVRVDGEPADRLADAEYRASITVGSHHAVLFSGSIAENLDPAAGGGDRIRRAVAAAACEDFLDVAGGMDASAGEMGNRFSGGQRQRLALARALAADAPVLVLHDPTIAVDSVTEARIASRIPDARRGRSTILIASSPALLNACERVVDIRGTSIRDTDIHDTEEVGS
ncbi:ABC transporter ATP-binding protein [Gulosibacter sp. 10]|uniref:ABC transporter transmembrane domain-containing protein n=1 Tax=Gulosibacter sp. 10 TaxID=1255570 RepID=UPI00097F1EA2|nr:ABC transporter ATP-binding protein [Gulosibacter sp. 10]SJM70749.1 Methionine ABC transporter ATP-binding protein [Gulosibacter sp. 10]